MILLDANIILRALAESTSEKDRHQQIAVQSLLTSAAAGQEEITASNAVLAEVAFVLTSKQNYGLGVETVAGLLAALVQLPGFRTAERSALLRGLEIWASRPPLGFVDALTAAQALTSGNPLATFDRHV